MTELYYPASVVKELLKERDAEWLNRASGRFGAFLTTQALPEPELKGGHEVKFVNVYEDAINRFISSEDYSSFKDAVDSIDQLSTPDYIETLGIIRGIK